MQKLVPELKMPSAEEEAADPATADAAYETCIVELKKATRENRLVVSENYYYGFRRNLLGLKPLGLVSAALGTGLPLAAGWSGKVEWGLSVYLSVVLSVMSALVWLLAIRPGWVRAAAEQYAERLLESA